MTVNISVDDLIKNDLSINKYLLCLFIYYQKEADLKRYIHKFDKFTKSDVEELISSGYISCSIEGNYTFSNLSVTSKFLETFIKSSKDRVEDWINEWYSLFPKGVKTMGYLVRAGLSPSTKKMKDFCKANPQFSKKIILKATDDYINYFKNRNWEGMQTSVYFIKKNGNSTLASLCESLLEKIESGETIDLNIGLPVTEDYGGSEFMEIL